MRWNFLVLLCASKWREERGFLVLLCDRGRELDGMIGAAMRWKSEGGQRGFLVLMRYRKKRWNACCCYALEDGGRKRGFMVLMR